MAFIDNKFYAGDDENIKENNFYQKVLGVEGTHLNTTSGMLEFKKGIEKLIEKNKDIKFINSSKGARIEGTIEMELKDLIKD
ncbi:hypothetical protein [Clostridium sporogenes]|uniref:hypothetical protein n=1 Tax=Clostridium sporogenes TaxID=1509 RepID=UPI002236F7DD|nr:hypothetical protein [Clostridium sporogenes]MCW6110442.1 hypothetical protein [Clostridium sporogenes]